MSSKYRITHHKAKYTSSRKLAIAEYWSVDRYAPNHGGWYKINSYHDELDAVNALVYLETPVAA